MSSGDDNLYCSGAGYTTQPDCECKCFIKVGLGRGSLNIESGEEIAQGDLCQHKCPVGMNGDICGQNGTPKPYIKGKGCVCKCTQSGSFSTDSLHCDDTCGNGGQYDENGKCKCVVKNQDPDQKCLACKLFWYNAPLCQSYCDSNTCRAANGKGGFCLTPDPGENAKCKCETDNHNPEIVRKTNIETKGTFISNTQAYKIKDLDITSIGPLPYIHMTADTFPSFRWHDSDFTELYPLTEREAAIQIPSGQDFMNFRTQNNYTLHKPVSVLWNYAGGNVRATPIVGVYLSALSSVDAYSLCAASTDCAGYTNTELYSCIGNSCPDSNVIDSGNNTLYRIARSVQLKESHTFDLALHTVTMQGCRTCMKDFYPRTRTGLAVTSQCINRCTSHETCSGYGVCDDNGECICLNANIQDKADSRICAVCKDTYYPPPFSEMLFNATEPCLNKCVDEALDDGGGEHWYCSGHGQCIGNGTCHADCIQFATGEPSGWSGAHCEVPCLAVENETKVCSGHGTCINSACACVEGFFGKLCDVTCNQENEYYHVVEEDCEGEQCHEPCEGLGDDVCQENIPCGTGDLFRCKRLKCNGRSCVTSYQYTHKSKTFYYEPCYAAVDTETLRECTGFSMEEYNSTQLNGKKIRAEHGIFCDTGARQNSNQGFCKKARCDCTDGDTARKITTDPPDDGTLIEVETLTVSANLGGEGCYVAGCRPADFPEGGNFYSMCGQYVPPVISDPVTLYDQLNNETGDISIILARELSRVQQHCAHGECIPRENQPGRSLLEPAPAGAEAVRGYCRCKNTPRVTKYCQQDGNADWAQQCCDTGARGSNIFFGRSCTDECKCDRKMFWKGSCGGDDTGVLSLGCNCRMGYSNPEKANNPKPGPLKELFCGSTCRTTCAGVMDDSQNQVVLSESYAGVHCPGAGASTAVHNASCYVGHMPCHGHGQCSSADGTCIRSIGNVLGVDSVASCQCWGSGVEMESNAAATLPQVVALYGGESSCELQCPFAGQLSDYFTQHYDVLLSANVRLTSQHRAIKQNYFNMYTEKVCSGHGYCTSLSPAANRTHLRCTCTGDYGGNDCDQTCKLSENAWGSRVPWQYGSQSGNGTLGSHLATYYGLSKCGTNARCSDEQVCAPIDNGYYDTANYDTAKQMVATLTESNMTTRKTRLFFEQWSLMFIGEFATCKRGYYSSVPRELDGQDTIYAFDLPTLVQWQLRRTCDAKYEYDTWSTQGASWCCNYAETGVEWRDDTAANFNGFTHGGCPDTYCSNFAVGRSCRTCISNAYESYNMPVPPLLDDCPTSYSGTGYCAKCTGTQDDHLVSPFKSLHSAGSARYKVHGKDSCEHCISYGRELSGEQQYALAATESRTCNNKGIITRGTCNGQPNTYSGIAVKPADVLMPSAGSLLCEGNAPHFTLGMCTCTEDWEGPTCAAPKTQKACGDDGTLVSTGVISPYSNIMYNKCVCRFRTGHYCAGNAVDTIYKFAAAELTLAQSIQLLPPNDLPALVVCNDPRAADEGGTVAVNGRCESCSDPSLDPFSMCIEYKATGVDGIVAQHQARVRDRSNC